MMDIKVVYNPTNDHCYLVIDVYGIFAESKWYKTREKLGYAMATNMVEWFTCEIEHDGEV